MNAFEFMQINKRLPLKMTEADFEQLEKDLSKTTSLAVMQERPIAAMKKSKIKKGFNADAKFDSF